MLSKLKLGPKLLLAPAVVLVLLIIVSTGAYYALVRQNALLETIVQQRTERMRAASDLVVDANRAHTEIYELLTWINASFSGARLDALVLEIQRRHAAIDGRYLRLQIAADMEPAERTLVEQSQAAHARYGVAITDVIEISMSDRSIAANAMMKAERAFDVVALRMGELSLLEQELSRQAYRRAEAGYRLWSVLLPVVVGLSIALSLLVTMLVRNALLKEVRQIGASALGLAQGNLMVHSRTYGSDEIGETSRTLDSSIRNLNATLSTILASAQSIDSASRDILHGSAAMSSRSAQQAGTMEEAALSMKVLSETLAQTASNAQVANQLALQAAGFAAKGGGVVQRLTATLVAIRSNARRVGEIIHVIDGIAFQTNILAMNATAEAERAGDHGRGFAVVATEVRTLAQRAAIAAREVKNMVAETAGDIDGGGRALGEAGVTLAEIAASVSQVDRMLGVIGAASAQQVVSASHVSEAILQMDQMTRQNSDLVVQAAARAQGLQHQVLGLSQAVASFKLVDDKAPLLGEPAKRSGAAAVARLRLASNRTDSPPDRTA